jgi:hypothetical protein
LHTLPSIFNRKSPVEIAENIGREYSSVFQRRRGAMRSMETAGRPNSANSFICLIEIQAKNVFFRVFAAAIRETFVFSDDFKTAFLQHSYRPGVVGCCPGENRPIYNKAEHPIERFSR